MICARCMAVFVRACDALDEYADHESRSITSGRLLTMTDDSNRRQPTNCHSSNHQTSMGCEESIRCCERVQSVQTCGTRVVTNRRTASTRRSLRFIVPSGLKLWTLAVTQSPRSWLKYFTVWPTAREQCESKCCIWYAGVAVCFHWHHKCF